jgi:hypothetical protein
MVVSPAEALRRIQELQAFVKEVMVEGVDFGVIPGTEKPTLLQPGAQKLCEIYGFAFSFEDSKTLEDWSAPLFHYEMRCVLTSRRDGRFIGDGIGSCNSKEKRYAGRWAFDNEIPPGVDKSTLKRREGKSKKNGRPYTQFFVANDDIYSIVNTMKKMACKRSLVHAVIGATRSAGIFTQDVEDLPREAFGKPDASRSWEDEPEETPKQEGPSAEQKALFEELMTALLDARTMSDLDVAMANVGRQKGKLMRSQLDVLRTATKELKGKLEPAGREPGDDTGDP